MTMLPNLPLPNIEQLETSFVLKKTADAHRYLACNPHKYLEQLVEHNFLHKEKIGRNNYYTNQPCAKSFRNLSKNYWILMTNNDIVQKPWNLFEVPRDESIKYCDYATELIMLLSH